MKPEAQRYDLVAVSLQTQLVRVLDTNLSAASAEGKMMFAVARRGVEEEFFATCPAGAYKDGDQWRGE